MALFSFPAQVNEYAARTVAGCVVAIVAMGFLLNAPWVLLILAAGFLLRVGWGPRFSPLARTAMMVAPKIWPTKPVAGPPKRFAQGVGAIFTVGASLLWLTGHVTAAWVAAGVIVVFATLEASIAFCMGCWVYGKLQQAGVIAPDTCVDCVPAHVKARAS